MSTYTLEFPWRTPPLTANQRLFWAAKADITRTVRRLAAALAKNAGIPALGRCEVTLTWHVNTNHRRDADNVVPTLKAICDGLVDAGVVTDDTPAFMVKYMPVIAKVEGQPAHFTLTVTQLEAVAA